MQNLSDEAYQAPQLGRAPRPLSIELFFENRQALRLFPRRSQRLNFVVAKTAKK